MVQPDLTLDDHGTDRWHRALSSSVSHRWPLVRKLAFGSVIAAFGACCVLLAAGGYPTARTVAFTCVGVVGFTLYILSRVRGSRLPRWADDDFALAFYFACSLCTGGIHSPIVVAGLAPLTRIVQTGATPWRPTARRLSASAMGLMALAVAPASWVGPPPPHLAYAPSVLAFLIPTIVLHVWRSSVEAATFEAMIGQVFRARDEVGSRALARARDLELLTARMSEELRHPLVEVGRRVDRTARTTPHPRTRKQLEVASSEIARMQSILEEYLSFSRPLASLRPEALRLREVVDDVLGAMEGRAQPPGVRARAGVSPALEEHTRGLGPPRGGREHVVDQGAQLDRPALDRRERARERQVLLEDGLDAADLALDDRELLARGSIGRGARGQLDERLRRAERVLQLVRELRPEQLELAGPRQRLRRDLLACAGDLLDHGVEHPRGAPRELRLHEQRRDEEEQQARRVEGVRDPRPHPRARQHRQRDEAQRERADAQKGWPRRAADVGGLVDRPERRRDHRAVDAAGERAPE